MVEPTQPVEAGTILGKAIRGIRRYARVLRAVVGLLVAGLRKQPTELWMGDSHAVYLNKDYRSGVLTRAPEGQLVWWLGPRLMWSLARNGFTPRVNRVARLIRLITRSGSLVPVFIVGEIDVRCHLVPRSSAPDFSLDFVADYVRNAHELAARMGARTVVFAVPVPPSADCPANPAFPIKGSIDERITVFGDLRTALAKEVSQIGGPPAAVLLDVTDALADDTGGFRPELTDDGCHTNPQGVRLVRDRVHQLQLRAQPVQLRR